MLRYIFHIETLDFFSLQEPRTSQLPLELDQIGDDSASVRAEKEDAKGKMITL